MSFPDTTGAASQGAATQAFYAAVLTENSFIEQHRPSLIKMLGEKNFHRARDLERDTFDPTLWKALNASGPTKYHWIIAKEELLPGQVWVQPQSSYHEDQFDVLWSTEPGWIHSACLAEHNQDKVIITSYMSHIINMQVVEEEVTVETFQELIDVYLNKTPNSNENRVQSLDARMFQQRLGTFPIVFTITRTACEKLAQLREEYSTSVCDMSVVLGINEKEGEGFNPLEHKGTQLIEISRYFINGRLPFIHEMEGKPEVTCERVAPVIRSWRAFDQLEKLRTMTKKPGAEDIFHLDPERSVTKIVSEDIASKSLQDLRACFVLVPGGMTVEAHVFEHLGTEKSSEGKERLELFIDCQEGNWRLTSQFFEKVYQPTCDPNPMDQFLLMRAMRAVVQKQA